MAITQNSFNLTCLSGLFLTVFKAHVRWVQNMRKIVKSPADLIFYIIWPQNYLFRVQTFFLYVCTVQLFNTNIFCCSPFQTKENSLQTGKNLSCPSSPQLCGTIVHHDTLPLKGKRQTYISQSYTILPSSMLTFI